MNAKQLSHVVLRAMLTAALIAPLAGILIASVCDGLRGGSPTATPFFWGIGLFDPRTWEIVGNSVFLALAVTTFAWIAALGLSTLMATSGRLTRVAAGVALLPGLIPPLCTALGLRTLWDQTPFARNTHGEIEAWLGVVWAELPWAIAYLTYGLTPTLRRSFFSSTAAARMIVPRRWGRLRAWRIAVGSSVRQSLIPRAGVLFLFVLFEPTAPWIFGLDRTLGVRIAQRVMAGEALEQAAVLAATSLVITWALFAASSWRFARRTSAASDADIPAQDEDEKTPPTKRRSTADSKRPHASVRLNQDLAGALALMAFVGLTWLPLGMLGRTVLIGTHGAPADLFAKVLNTPFGVAQSAVDTLVVGGSAATLALLAASLWVGVTDGFPRPTSRIGTLLAWNPALVVTLGWLAFSLWAGSQINLAAGDTRATTLAGRTGVLGTLTLLTVVLATLQAPLAFALLRGWSQRASEAALRDQAILVGAPKWSAWWNAGGASSTRRVLGAWLGLVLLGCTESAATIVLSGPTCHPWARLVWDLLWEPRQSTEAAAAGVVLAITAIAGGLLARRGLRRVHTAWDANWSR